MRPHLGLVVLLGMVKSASADVAAVGPGEPAPPPPPPGYAPPPAGYAPAPAEPQAPPTMERRRSWFVGVGIGGGGYVGRAVPQNDDSDSGIALEAMLGKWMSSQELAIGARFEAHSDDTERYTDSALTAILRFPLGARGRGYLEPGIGIAFHKDERFDETDAGMAVAITAGYSLLPRRFAIDLRGGLAHHRHDPEDNNHGLVWIGIALGMQ